MSLFGKEYASKVFTEGTMITGKPLKNLDALREAYIYNELSSMSKKDIKEFANSKEAKFMLEEEIISYDTLERLMSDEYNDSSVQFAVCHLAKENDDERWNELVKAREEERRIMNDLIQTYGESARKLSENYRENFLHPAVPKRYLVNED